MSEIQIFPEFLKTPDTWGGRAGGQTPADLPPGG